MRLSKLLGRLSENFVRMGFPSDASIRSVLMSSTSPFAWLAIEIDGSIHGRSEVQLRDREREKELAELGWSVVRFSAEEAMHPDYLVSKVMERLGL